MKIEILYPEICNLFGDLMNARYLARSCSDAEIIETGLKDSPAFLEGGVSLVYIGSTTERGQALAVSALMPHKDRIAQLIKGGQAFLVTGNAMELFGQYIENEDGSRIECLGLFDTYAKRVMMARYNSLYLGKFGDDTIIGFKSQFSHSYGEGGDGLFDTVRGAGRNPDISKEGFRLGNFMATYILGPVVILNPPFAKYLLALIGADSETLAFEEAAYDVYNLRVKEFSEPDRGFIY